jgi:hypothetical protein
MKRIPRVKHLEANFVFRKPVDVLQTLKGTYETKGYIRNNFQFFACSLANASRSVLLVCLHNKVVEAKTRETRTGSLASMYYSVRYICQC